MKKNSKLIFNRTFSGATLKKFLACCERCSSSSVGYLEAYEIQNDYTGPGTVITLTFSSAENAFIFGYEWANTYAKKEETI